MTPSGSTLYALRTYHTQTTLEQPPYNGGDGEGWGKRRGEYVFLNKTLEGWHSSYIESQHQQR